MVRQPLLRNGIARNPNGAPPLPPGMGMSFAFPGPPAAFMQGQRCTYDFECAPGEYCHAGGCLPSPWSRSVGVAVEQPRTPNPRGWGRGWGRGWRGGGGWGWRGGGWAPWPPGAVGVTPAWGPAPWGAYQYQGGAWPWNGSAPTPGRMYNVAPATRKAARIIDRRRNTEIGPLMLALYAAGRVPNLPRVASSAVPSLHPRGLITTPGWSAGSPANCPPVQRGARMRY